jgi:uncharacterized membrane protein required for colicin V production
MNAGGVVDALIVLFLILQTYLGWRRGLLWQVAGVASVIFGVILGWALAPCLSGAFHEHITSNAFHARLAAFIFVQAAVGFALRMAASWAEVRSEMGLEKPERDKRRAEDRILGGIFGALKGCVVTLVIVGAAGSCFPSNALWPKSTLAAPLAQAGARLLPEGAVKEVAQWASRSAADVGRNLDIK